MIAVLKGSTKLFRKTSCCLTMAAAGVAALSAFTQTFAADLPLTGKAQPISPAPILSWAGLYIGANAGWASSGNCWDLVPPTPLPPALLGSEGCHNATGAVAGGQIGYRWQAGAAVFGLEAQGNWANLNGSNISPPFPNTSNRSQIQAFGLLTGQAGWAMQNSLFYIKGGAAVADSQFRYTDNATGTVLGAASETRWGGAVGLGLEYSFAPNWSVALEYDHVFMPERTHNFVSPGGAYAGTLAIHQDVNLVTVRMNYRFGGPTILKY